MTTIETLLGNVNLRDGQAKAYCFHCPPEAQGIEERHLGQAAKSSQTYERVQQVTPFVQAIAAVQGYTVEHGGKTSRVTYQVAEGEIIKVFGQRRAGANKLPVSASMFLRVRDSAALREVRVKFLTDPKIVEPFAFVRGRFDIITVEDAIAAGIKVNPNFIRQFGSGAVSHIMEVIVAAPETATVTQVPLAAGGVKSIVTPIRRRYIKMP